MTLSVRISHGFGAFSLDVGFEAPAGVTVLYGRSGAGKTSVVNAVAGLIRPDSGRISVSGVDLLDTAKGRWVPPHRRRIGYVFQESRLFPHMNVRRNLDYGRRLARPGTPQREADRVIGMLDLDNLLERRPGDLSGGEKQRVAIGRALLANPRLLLADEPLSSLDDGHKEEIIPCFERLRDEFSVPVLYVSHSPAEVARLASSVVVLERGRVARQGTAAEVLGDPQIIPAGVRGAGALIEATVARHHDDGLTELTAGGIAMFLPECARAPGSRLRVRIAAHDVIVSKDRPEGLSALNVFPGTVAEIRPGSGPGAMVLIDTAAGRLLARVTRRSAAALGLQAGMPCHAIVKTVSIAPLDIGGA